MICIKQKKIPNGHYCYNDDGWCPFWREDKSIKANFFGFGYESSAWCDYLKLNSAVLDFEGVYEKNGAKCITGQLINDLCKVCGINE